VSVQPATPAELRAHARAVDGGRGGAGGGGGVTGVAAQPWLAPDWAVSQPLELPPHLSTALAPAARACVRVRQLGADASEEGVGELFKKGGGAPLVAVRLLYRGGAPSGAAAAARVARGRAASGGMGWASARERERARETREARSLARSLPPSLPRSLPRSLARSLAVLALCPLLASPPYHAATSPPSPSTEPTPHTCVPACCVSLPALFAGFAYVLFASVEECQAALRALPAPAAGKGGAEFAQCSLREMMLACHAGVGADAETSAPP
jgi:hypothetical protein